MNKVLFLDKPHPVLEERLSAMGLQCEADYEGSQEEIMDRLHQYTGLVMRSRFTLNERWMDKGTHLRFIAREGVGTEHIPVEYAESKGIKVLTSPEGSRDTVGEHAIGLLLMLMNNLGRADRQVRQGQWIREGNRGVELMGKTVGVIGYGNMGTAFARRLSGFGVEVIAYDKFKTDYGDAFARAVSLDDIFEKSDIISLHIPYSHANHYFVNDEFLSRFHKEIYLINTARGLILRTADLVRHLKYGKVRGAALDVLEYEDQSFYQFTTKDLPADFDYLCQAPNVVLSPHIAGWSFESKRKHAEVLAEKIRELIAGSVSG